VQGAALININRAILAATKLQTTDLSCRRGDTVYTSGAPAHSVYVVKKGALYRFRLLPEGQRLILQFLFRGDGFGYEKGPNHRNSVRALANTQLSVAGRKALLAASAADARSSNLLLAAPARAAVLAEEQSIIRRTMNATERAALFLLEMNDRLSRNGKIDLPMTQRHISGYLGLTPETISRLMKEFKRSKIIRFRDNRPRQIVIHDKKRLAMLASDASDFRWWET